MHERSEREIIDGLLDALNAVPRAFAREAMFEGADTGVDASIRLNVGDREIRLLVQAKQTVFPRDVHAMLWRLHNTRRRNVLDQTIVPMIAAQTLSPGARDEIREAGVGYYDASGSLYVPADPIHIFVDRPRQRAQARRLASVFQGRRGSVLRCLFAHRGDWVNLVKLTRESGVSPATASETLTELERRDWVETRGRGPSKQRRLTRAGEILDAWAQEIATAPGPRWTRYYVPKADAARILKVLPAVGGLSGARYAVTGEAAAQAYSPYLTAVSQVHCRLLPGPQATEMLERMQARRVDEGWNLAVLETRDLSDFADTQIIDETTYASPLQVYLDLQHGAGRAKDIAEHLRREVLEV